MSSRPLVLGRTKAAPAGWARAAAVVSAVLVGLGLTLVLSSALWTTTAGLDFRIYEDRVGDFLAGRGLYLPHQLAGPYAIANGDSLYPPVIVLLVAPFLVLPAILWWAIPLGIMAVMVAWHRPARWAWPLLALLLVLPPTLATMLKGNPVIWCGAALALAARWPAWSVFVFLKPSLFPFALVGIRSRWWWVTLAACLAVSLPFGALWLDWIATLRNAQGSGLLYSIDQVPFLLLPLVAAWSARDRE